MATSNNNEPQNAVSALNDLPEQTNAESVTTNQTEATTLPEETDASTSSSVEKLNNNDVTKPEATGSAESPQVTQSTDDDQQLASNTTNDVNTKNASPPADDNNAASSSDMVVAVQQASESGEESATQLTATTTSAETDSSLAVVNTPAMASSSSAVDAAINADPLPIAITKNAQTEIGGSKADDGPSGSASSPIASSSRLNESQTSSSNCDSSNVVEPCEGDKCAATTSVELAESSSSGSSVAAVESNSIQFPMTASVMTAEPTVRCPSNKSSGDCETTQPPTPPQSSSLPPAPTSAPSMQRDPNCSEAEQMHSAGDVADSHRSVSTIVERSSVINSTSCDSKSMVNSIQPITDKGGGSSCEGGVGNSTTAGDVVSKRDYSGDRDTHRPRRLSNTSTDMSNQANSYEKSRINSHDKSTGDIASNCKPNTQNEALVKPIQAVNFNVHSNNASVSAAVQAEESQLLTTYNTNGANSADAASSFGANTNHNLGNPDLSLRMTSPCDTVVSSYNRREDNKYGSTATSSVTSTATSSTTTISTLSAITPAAGLAANSTHNVFIGSGANSLHVDSAASHQRISNSSENSFVKKATSRIDKSYETLDLTSSDSAVSNRRIDDKSVAPRRSDDLSPLRMKPPDFSKLTQNLHVPNPDFSRYNDFGIPHKPKTIVDSSNFAEISRKYNYISDLQLKNPSAGVPVTVEKPAPKWNSNLYVKTPDFSVVRGNVDTPTHAVNNEYSRDPHSTSSAYQSHIDARRPEVKIPPIPQLSQDVTMSIVNPPHENMSPKLCIDLDKANESKPLKYSTEYSGSKYSEYHYKQAMAKNYEKCRQEQVVNNHYSEPVLKGHPSLYSEKPVNSPYLRVSHESVAKPEVNYHPYRRQDVPKQHSDADKNKVKSQPVVHSSYGSPQGHYGSAMHSRVQPMPMPMPTASKPVGSNDYGRFPNSELDTHMRRSAPVLSGHSPLPPPSNIQSRSSAIYDPMSAAASATTNHHINPDTSPSPTSMNSRLTKSPSIQIRNSSTVPAGGMMHPPHPSSWTNQNTRVAQVPSPHTSSASSPRHFQRPIPASPSPQSIPSSSPSPYRNVPSPTQYHHQSMVFDKHGAPPQPPNSYYNLQNAVPRHGQDIPVKDSHMRYPSGYLHRDVSPSAAAVASGSSDYYQRYIPSNYPQVPSGSVKSDKTPSKPIGFVDLTKSTTPTEQDKYNRYGATSTEMPSQRQPTPSELAIKYPTESKQMSRNNRYQKTIMDPYLFRHASEEDLNMQIINKTLNKNVSMRRSDSDLSRNIFDSAHASHASKTTPETVAISRGSSHHKSHDSLNRAPSSSDLNNSYYQRKDSANVTSLKSSSSSKPEYTIKVAEPTPNRYDMYKQSGDSELSQRLPEPHISKHEERLPRVPGPNFGAPRQHGSSLKMGELKKHDLSVTVSKFSQSFMNKSSEVVPSVAPNLTTATITKVKTEPEPAAPIQVNDQKPYNAMLVPIKRESPLDLSVKTVKTKADSTGSDDISGLPHVGEIKEHHPLKVNFEPNFSQHTEFTTPSNLQERNQIPSYYMQSSLSKMYPPGPSRQNPNPLHGYPYNEATARSSLEPSRAPGPHYIDEAKNVNDKKRVSNDRMAYPSSSNFETKFESYPLASGSPYRSIVEDSKSKLPNPFSKRGIEKSYRLQHEYNAQLVKTEPRMPVATTSTITSHKVEAHPQQIPQPPPPQPQHDSGYHSRELNPVKMENDPFKSRVLPFDQRKAYPPTMEQTPPMRYDKNDVNHMRPAYYMPTDNRINHSTSAVNPFEEPVKKSPFEYKPPSLHGGQEANAAKKLLTECKDGARKRNLSESEQYTNTKQPRNNLPYPAYEVKRDYPNSAAPRKEMPHPNSMPTKPYHYRAQEYDHKSQYPIGMMGNYPPNGGESYRPPMPYNQAPQPNGPIKNPTTNVIQNARERIPSSPPYPPPPLPPNAVFVRPHFEKGPPQPYPAQQFYQQAHPQQHHPQSYQYQVWHPPKATESDRLNMKATTVNGRTENTSSATITGTVMAPGIPPKHDVNFYHNHQPGVPPPETRPANLPIEASTSFPVRLENKQTEILRPTTHSGLKGADQMVITKLRNSLELKEMEKQRIMRTVQSTGDALDDDKADIASIIAARIRTKGELKGFTSVPYVDPKKAAADTSSDVAKTTPPQATPSTSSMIMPPPPPRPSSVARDLIPLPSAPFPDTKDAFNLMDWGSACCEFVEQLQTGKKRRRKSAALLSLSTPSIDAEYNKMDNLPGKEYQCHIDESVVLSIKAECLETLDSNAILSSKASSSDEDKPLCLLRQQSLNEKKKELSESDKGTKDESKVNGGKAKVGIKSEDSDSISGKSGSDKATSKAARSKQTKQRIEQEKRLAARFSTSSSSDDEESRSSMKRSKKVTRKPRTRSNVGVKDSFEGESSADEDGDTKKMLAKKDAKKRKKQEKLSSDSEPVARKKKVYRRASKLDSDKDEQSEEENSENEAKAVANKDKQQLNDTCSSTEDESKAEGGSIKKEKRKGATTAAGAVTSKKAKEEAAKEKEKNEQSSDQQDREKCGKLKSSTKSGKSVSTEIKVGETMTRAKKKRVMEQQIANGKVLRNEKIVQNVVVEKRNIVAGTVTPSTSAADGKKSAEKDTKTSSSGKTTKRDQSTKNTTPPKTSGEKGKENTGKSEVKRKLVESDDEDSSNGKSKKKSSRKNVQLTSSSDNDSDETADAEVVVERLRPRRAKLETPEKTDIKSSKDKAKQTSAAASFEQTEIEKKTSQKGSKKNAVASSTKEHLANKFQPGWEEGVYHTKCNLWKVPQSLISVVRPEWQRKSTSLPDLDPHSSDASESLGELKKKGKKSGNNEEKLKKKLPPPTPAKTSSTTGGSVIATTSSEQVATKHKSIIEVLHQRVGRPLKQARKGRPASNTESKIMPQSNETELLPTPGGNSESIFGQHKTIFETAVLPSRTRTAYRVNKTKEIIREVFGCDDRPASAPPMVKPEEEEPVVPMTFVQKFQEYLKEMSVGYGEPIRKNKVSTNTNTSAKKPDAGTAVSNSLAVTIKQEKMEFDTPPIVVTKFDGVMPAPPSKIVKKKGKSGRGSRRKGSSGFDYIRKKKKPVTDPNAPHTKRKSAAINYLEEKDESDISREIRGWVLNKGVGESVLHKAARLGYADVIAFCLERLDMHPDAKDNAGYTPLHEACSRGRVEIARLLLRYGANHSETAHSGIRPLHEAAENGYVEVCRLLLSFGADPLIATYAGQTPYMLATDDEMKAFLERYLSDTKDVNPVREPWHFEGPWEIFDCEENGFDIFADPPITEIQPAPKQPTEDTTKMFNKPKPPPPQPPQPPQPPLPPPPAPEGDKKNRRRSKEGKCDSNSNIMVATDTRQNNNNTKKASKESVDGIREFKKISWKKEIKREYESMDVGTFMPPPPPVKSIEAVTNAEEEEGELFEAEESDMPLPPLYRLKEEGTEKWVLLNDLLPLLKVKSKDTLLKMICPTNTIANIKELQRELKMDDFLREATCMQLLCAGEKLNMRSSAKVVLIKYNDSVKNLLGVNTIVMHF